MHIIQHHGHIVGATLLVAGISLGVGMLALPVATAQGGFFPAVALYLVCWFFMLCTGLLILEATTWMPNDSNLITMSERLLGKGGKIFCWLIYLFLFSTLMVAHVAGGGNIMSQITGGSLSTWMWMIIYVCVFAPVVYFGPLWVDRLNIILMCGIAVTYLAFIFTGIEHIDFGLLSRSDWPKMWLALPVVFTAFGYQTLIPTLMTYLKRDVRKVRLAIIFGTMIPLVIYIVWELLILGIVPLEGSNGLLDSLKRGESAVYPLGHFLQSKAVLAFGEAFAFFAVTTSFVGIAIAFVDFLADGLKVKKKGLGKFGLCALVFVVPLIITLIDPTIFLKSLGYAGGYGVALLLGAMPVAMVWAGRYYQKQPRLRQRLPGGKIALSILMLFVAIELLSQLL